jgi:dephospho-CoA kinase
MRIIGLTGSIATGKSTVSHLLSSAPFSLRIIDADLLARQVVEPGTQGYKAIVGYFGPSTPDLLLPFSTSTSTSTSTSSITDTGGEGAGDGDGRPQQSQLKQQRPLNRAVLGRRVFGTDAARQRDRKVLEGIIHPAVRRAIFTAIVRAYVRGEKAVVLDVPLLFEAGLDVLCATVLVIGIRDPEVQVERLRRRDEALSKEDAWGRVRSQGALKGKVERVEGWGWVVWNDGGKEELKSEVENVMERISQTAELWRWLLWLMPPVMIVLAAWGLAKGVWRRRRWEKTQTAKEKDKIS